MGNLWIYKRHVYQQTGVGTSEGMQIVELESKMWVPVSDCEPVSFSDIQRWYRSSVFELDVML